MQLELELLLHCPACKHALSPREVHPLQQKWFSLTRIKQRLAAIDEFERCCHLEPMAMQHLNQLFEMPAAELDQYTQQLIDDRASSSLNVTI